MIRPTADSGDGAPVQIGILTVDRALAVRTWDGWMAAATGIPAREACGRALADVVPSLAERGLLARFEHVLASGEVQVLAPTFHHYLVPCPPREPSRHFDRMQQRVTLGPLLEGTRVVGVMATVEDVTARIERERDLAAGLRDHDWKVRRSAVQGLARDAHPDMLVSLLASLRTEHRDFNVLSSALQLLGTAELDITAPLAALLQEPDADLRIQAALALGERQTPAAVEALLGALQDPDVNVRFHAIEGLGRLRAGDAVDALADIAERDDFFLVFPAIDALARIHDGRVAPRLIPLLRRSDITEPVADALGEIGGAEAVPPLVEVLNTTGPAGPIARALARLHERYEQRYSGGALIQSEFQSAIAPAGAQRILDAVTTSAGPELAALVPMLGWLRGPAVERALARLLARPAVRSAVIEAIVRQDTGVVDILIEQLRSDDADVRLAAIVALGRMGDRRATTPLAALLGSARAEAVAAAAALAQIGDPAAFDALLPLLSHDDATVRQAAIGALNSLGHPDMAPRIARLLASPDPHVRESAARIAGYFGYRECTDALIALCADAVHGVRRAAVEQLPFLDDPGVGERLRAALRDPVAPVRAAAAQALAHMTPKEAREPLLAATTDSDAWVRYYAVRALAELREPPAVPRLADLAASDPAMHVRIAAVEAIGAIDGPGAIDILLPHALSGNVDIAAAALRSLGRVGDPRAAGTLRDALRAEHAMRRLAAVTGLRACGTAEGIAALEWTAAGDADEPVALAAIEALGALGSRAGAEADAAVDALVATTAEPRRREAVVAALARLPEARIARVADALTHPQPAVRGSLVDALARMRHPRASAAIRAALEDPAPEVREAAITALDRLGVRGVGRAFARMAREDASRGVRRAAAIALGRASDAPGSGPAGGTR